MVMLEDAAVVVEPLAVVSIAQRLHLGKQTNLQKRFPKLQPHPPLELWWPHLPAYSAPYRLGCAAYHAEPSQTEPVELEGV
jgi:hypothetical protein